MRALLMIGLVLLAACGTPVPAPQDHFYRLPTVKPASESRMINGVLRVEPLEAGGLVRERYLIYIDSEDSVELERYHYHLWHKSPAYMLQDHLADYLYQVDSAMTVTTDNSFPADAVISGDLHQFMQIKGEDGGRVVVDLELRLRRNDGNESVFQKRYMEQESVNGQGMQAVVMAFSRALNRIYADFSASVRL